ncbi:MAG: hypothetical protein NC548_29670 [Lachnospiraceae bacterium]|nr:hypothetical protein [Lachnospiraceae bacterium]
MQSTLLTKADRGLRIDYAIATIREIHPKKDTTIVVYIHPDKLAQAFSPKDCQEDYPYMDQVDWDFDPSLVPEVMPIEYSVGTYHYLGEDVKIIVTCKVDGFGDVVMIHVPITSFSDAETFLLDDESLTFYTKTIINARAERMRAEIDKHNV